jgi:hypothetical protein
VVIPSGAESSNAHPFRWWLYVGCLLLGCGATLSCVTGINSAGAVLTLRALIALPILAFLVIPRLKAVPLKHVVVLLAVLTLVNFILSIIQNQLPPDHFFNRYSIMSEDTNVVTAETGVRATGTFSFITGLAVMSSIGVWAGIVILSEAEDLYRRMLGWLSIVSGIGCALTSVSRAPLVIGMGMLCVWLLATRISMLFSWNSVFAGILVLMALVIFDAVPKLSELSEGLLQRHESAGDSIEDRLYGQILVELSDAISMAPLGNGLGTEQVGGNYAVGQKMQFTTFETQFGRLVMELGVVGLLGFFVICIGALLALQHAKKNSEKESDKSILFASQILLILTFATNIAFNHVASAFIWMIFSVVLSSCSTEIRFDQYYNNSQLSRKRSSYC